MERKIKIITGNVTAGASLLNTSTADAVWNALPLESKCNLWGDEVYFNIPVSHDLEEDACEVVEKGDLAYWPQGPAFCIFFGPTPVSKGNEIKPASAVNVFGKVFDDPTVFKKVTSNVSVKVEKAE